MRKIIALALIVGLLLVGAQPAFATMNRFNQDQEVLIWTSVTALGPPSAGYTTTLATSDTILVVGSHRILGISVTDASGAESSEAVAAFYDAAAITGLIDAKQLECEIETEAGETLTIWFPYPYEMVNGCVVAQGAYTSVQIFYETYGR